MPTKEAIERLPSKVRVRLEMFADIILDYRDKNTSVSDEFKHKLYGYLEALNDIGILSESDMRCLFLYYKNIQTRFHVVGGK